VTMRLLLGDARERLRELAEGSVHCCVTSPPYCGLRDYGIPPVVWEAPDLAERPYKCEHEWGARNPILQQGNRRQLPHGDGRTNDCYAGERVPYAAQQVPTGGVFCSLCGAWRGSLGLEPSLSLYVAHIVEVFREVRRVLRDDGTLWLNLGDSYASQGGDHGGRQDNQPGVGAKRAHDVGAGDSGSRHAPDGLKPKDLCMVPARVTLALQADGWYVRSVMPWVKLNPMPESVTDRPTSAVEYWILLTKGPRYFWDAEAVRRVHARLWAANNGGTMMGGNAEEAYAGRDHQGRAHSGAYPLPNPGGRNFRNSDLFFDSLRGLLGDEDGDPLALVTATESFKGAHFATFGRKLIEPLILAATSSKGCCPKCGSPWARVVEKTGETHHKQRIERGGQHSGDDETGHSRIHAPGFTHNLNLTTTATLGWQPTCSCLDRVVHAVGTAAKFERGYVVPEEVHQLAEDMRPVPCTVLDPFLGSGTTAIACERLGRRWTGCEISLEYARLAEARIARERAQIKLPMEVA